MAALRPSKRRLRRRVRELRASSGARAVAARVAGQVPASRLLQTWSRRQRTATRPHSVNSTGPQLSNRRSRVYLQKKAPASEARKPLELQAEKDVEQWFPIFQNANTKPKIGRQSIENTKSDENPYTCILHKIEKMKNLNVYKNKKNVQLLRDRSADRINAPKSKRKCRIPLVGPPNIAVPRKTSPVEFVHRQSTTIQVCTL